MFVCEYTCGRRVPTMVHRLHVNPLPSRRRGVATRAIAIAHLATRASLVALCEKQGAKTPHFFLLREIKAQ